MSLYIDIGAHNTKNINSKTGTSTKDPVVSSSPSVFTRVRQSVIGEHASHDGSPSSQEYMEHVGSDVRTGLAAPATWLGIKLGLRHEHGGQEPSKLAVPYHSALISQSSGIVHDKDPKNTARASVSVFRGNDGSQSTMLSEENSNNKRLKRRFSGRPEGIDQFGGEESERIESELEDM